MDYGAEHILLYLNDGMNAREKEAFETACREDKDLRERLEACRDAMDYYRRTQEYAGETASLKLLTGELGKQYFSTPEVQPVRKVSLYRNRNLAAMAAALALLVFAGFYWFYTPDPLSAYGHLPAIAVTERGNTAEQDKSELASLINKKDYPAALPLARKLIDADSASISNRLYYGLCLLHTRSYERSRYWLQPVYAGNSLLKYRAALLIGLSYQQEGRKAESTNILEQIPPEADEYKDAQSLLRRLR